MIHYYNYIFSKNLAEIFHKHIFIFIISKLEWVDTLLVDVFFSSKDRKLFDSIGLSMSLKSHIPPRFIFQLPTYNTLAFANKMTYFHSPMNTSKSVLQFHENNYFSINRSHRTIVSSLECRM